MSYTILEKSLKFIKLKFIPKLLYQTVPIIKNSSFGYFCKVKALFTFS
jgi:hypothetical protein